MISMLKISRSGALLSIKSHDLEWVFSLETSAPISLDAWVPYALYRLDSNGDRMYSGAAMTSVGSVWETAILEPGEDFVGGGHGHQEKTAVSLWVDGAELPIGGVVNHSALRVELRQTSTLTRWVDDVAFATIDTVWDWTIGNSMTQVSVVTWLENHATTYAYLGMFPILRVAGAQQVSDSVTFHPSQDTFDVSEAGHGLLAQSGESGVRIGDYAEGIDFNINHVVSGTSITWMKVSDEAVYNKVYANYTAAGASAGDVWSARIDYRWSR